ncbi:RING finger protein unkempt homolog isoform X1 [Mytilus trossulus]|uniref:RING finger protein unkempt homolog isoform X1 n=1 Tax=Mytilus trossulus TaxID=6551 RepID=UPI003003ACFF
MRIKTLLTTKMPSESPVVAAQTEKPQHYLYLKEFRTQQCPLFLQHKCTQHRPFTCFHWHFLNQRRRRPVRKRDGTFNYSPDVYCTKYDETNGACPDGDDCPYLHRTAGDTERRYHLRYYKTGTCVYETDSKGNCVKNGPHCAFAHGAHDLRPPIYDVRELQAIDTINISCDKSSNASSISGTPSSLEKDKILAEDPRWNDTNYVLENYKTEQCKRPPRLCRQGYACPSYHNTRDRRRSPKLFKYRSTPCPNVKHGDDWSDPTQCENGDNCAYCHTRTEQQFHPEIYKSTKCNDMVQTNHCPRGPFCAFAHVENEITTARDVGSSNENSLAEFVSTVLPPPTISNINPITIVTTSSNGVISEGNQINQKVDLNGSSQWKFPDPIGKERANSVPYNCPEMAILGTYRSYSFDLQNNSSISSSIPSHTSSPLPEPIGKGRSSSTSSSITSDSGLGLGFYPRAPGSEREDSQFRLKQQLAAIDGDHTIDTVEKAKRKQNLILVSAVNCAVNTSSYASVTGMSNMSPLAPAFYPPGDTVGSVIGHALEDLCLDDIDLNSLDKELDRDDTNSLSSSISAGISSGYGCGNSSLPIGIPGGLPRGSVGSLSQSPPSPFGSFSHQLLTNQKNDDHISSLLNYNNSKYSTLHSDVNSMSPRSGPLGPHSPLYSSSLSNSTPAAELHKLREESVTHKAKVDHWEHAYLQAKCACEAWKKEAEESMRKTRNSDEEKNHAIKQRDEAIQRCKLIQQQLEIVSSNSIRCLTRINELDSLSLTQMRQVQQQLKMDLERMEKMILYQQSVRCALCQDKMKSSSPLPCSHRVLCDTCSSKAMNCPICHTQISRSLSVGGYRL